MTVSAGNNEIRARRPLAGRLLLAAGTSLVVAACGSGRAASSGTPQMLSTTPSPSADQTRVESYQLLMVYYAAESNESIDPMISARNLAPRPRSDR